MTEPLTREQVVEIGSWFTDPDRMNISRDASGKVCALVATDAALRDENERLKGEIDTLDSLLKDRTAQLAAEHKERVRFQKYHEEGGRVNAELKDQLEAMTKERDDFRESLHHRDIFVQQQRDRMDALEQQLATAQARVRELEAATALDVDRMERAAIELENYSKHVDTLTARCAQVEEALKNCYVMARRVIASGKFSAKKMSHIVRFCEDVGIASNGVLREQALTPAAEKKELEAAMTGARGVQRYNYRPGIYDTKIKGFRPEMAPNDQGDWVRYIDITAALDARERAMWEEAAQEWDAYANSDKKLKDGKTFADVCRQKGNGS